MDQAMADQNDEYDSFSAGNPLPLETDTAAPWLPVEVQAYLLRFTDARTLAVCAQVCHAWKQFASELTRRHEWRCQISSGDTLERFVMFFVMDNSKVDASDAWRRIRSRFPKSTHVIGCTGRGIIGMEEKPDTKGRPTRRPLEIESSKLPTISVTAAQLPPNISCSSFHLFDKDTQEQRLRSISEIPRDARLVVMLFGTSFRTDKAVIIDQRFPGAVKLGGLASSRAVKRELLFQNDSSVPGTGLVGLALGGAIKFNTDTVSDEDVSESLRGMAQWHQCPCRAKRGTWVGDVDVSADALPLPPCKSVAGMLFTCVGRGEAMHGVSNAEASLFARECPSVPLTGFFTGGELHSDYVGTTHVHGFTSVYCLVHE
eukprot:Opistho-2@75172